MAAIFATVSAMSITPAMAASVPIEKYVIYYIGLTQVGDATFYCDGTIVTNGFVSSEAVEYYYGC
ncbi:MAG: hypothetical protein V4574_11605 [Pseudomonadota bacterium]